MTASCGRRAEAAELVDKARNKKFRPMPGVIPVSAIDRRPRRLKLRRSDDALEDQLV